MKYVDSLNGRSGSMAACLTLLTSVATAHAASDVTFNHAWQYPAGHKPTFHMSGTAIDQGNKNGTAILDAITMPDGTRFEHFYYPTRVFDLVYTGDDKSFGVSGGTATNSMIQGRVQMSKAADHLHAEGMLLPALEDAGVAKRLNETTWKTSMDVPDLLSASGHNELDHIAMNAMLNYSISVPDVATYIDTTGGDEIFWAFTIEFPTPIVDDDTAPDGRGELIYFERGAGAGNSSLTIQAVDESGNPLGEAITIGADETRSTTPPTNLGQEFGAAAIDLSRLGVTEARYIRVSKPRKGVAGFVSGETRPDFKFLAMYTTDPDPRFARKVMDDMTFD